MEFARAILMSNFSSILPNLQINWSPSALYDLQFCPRYYQQKNVMGFREASIVDLEFGSFFANSTEVYAKARIEGLSKHDATVRTVRFATEATWLVDTDGNGRPWGGIYTEQWHCSGTNKYKNKKGNAAKCPYSHKGKWFLGDGPQVCGECGSEIVRERRWLPDDKVKNRRTLIRTVAWYCLEQPERPEDGGLYPYSFPDGTPAVELTFKLPLPWNAPSGEQYIISGRMDGIKTFGKEHFITDNKTTKALSQNYWKQFTPNIQGDVYDLVGNIMYPDLHLNGFIIEAAQVQIGGSKYAMMPFKRTEGQREETLREIGWWIRQAERYAQDDYWPMNKVNCKMCIFNQVCSKDPAQRQSYLKADYVQKEKTT